MKSTIAMLTTLLSISVTAETATFTVTGMDCGGCKKIVTKALCEDKIISATLSSCEVSVDEKTKTGTVILKSKDSVKIDTAMIETKIHASGENYKVSKTEISK